MLRVAPANFSPTYRSCDSALAALFAGLGGCTESLLLASRVPPRGAFASNLVDCIAPALEHLDAHEAHTSPTPLTGPWHWTHLRMHAAVGRRRHVSTIACATRVVRCTHGLHVPTGRQAPAWSRVTGRMCVCVHACMHARASNVLCVEFEKGPFCPHTLPCAASMLQASVAAARTLGQAAPGHTRG